MTDPSPILTERQCIKVSINSFCNESADSFQVQLHYTEGTCAMQAPTKSTDIDTLSENYIQCVSIKAVSTICYSAEVYHDGIEVGRTERQQLILLPCNTSSLNFEGVIVNMGEVMPGEEVNHSTILELQCDTGYNPASGSEFLFRCVNGTIQPAPRTNNTLCTSSIGTGTYIIMHVYTNSIDNSMLWWEISHSEAE